jgi:hypothetical protein
VRNSVWQFGTGNRKFRWRACVILNGKAKWFNHSNLSSFGAVKSTLGVGGCGREIFASATCQLQFAEASAAKLSQQEKKETVHLPRGRSKYIRLYRNSRKLSLAPRHLRRARVVGSSSAAGAQPLTHVCTAGACGKKTAWASGDPAGAGVWRHAWGDGVHCPSGWHGVKNGSLNGLRELGCFRKAVARRHHQNPKFYQSSGFCCIPQ